MVEEIYKRIWELSPKVQTRESYQKLIELTDELITLYDEQGRLNNDPFAPTRERILSLPTKELRNELKGSICIVTGGLGCVGSILVSELLKFNVKSVIIIDINQLVEPVPYNKKVINRYCDVRNIEHMMEIFYHYRPRFVFHTAAKRDPGFAESYVEEAVSTNVLGTLNVVKACEATGSVKQMVFSSTGKTSRYFTEEVYAASKKICEFILDTHARESRIKYTMARFTHILDNSLMNMELLNASRNAPYVPIHSPGKYVIAQNAIEAAHLMLNGLIYSQKKQCNFLTVRHLEWPVESLEMALYHIKESRRTVPIIFAGNPKGYAEKFFRGQMDWSKPNEMNLLINVYEQEHRHLNEANDINISRICPTDADVLEAVLDRLKDAKGDKEVRLILIEGLKEIVAEELKQVDEARTVSILEWGLDPQFLEIENIQASDFGAIVPILMESLEGSRYYYEVEELVHQHYSVVLAETPTLNRVIDKEEPSLEEYRGSFIGHETAGYSTISKSMVAMNSDESLNFESHQRNYLYAEPGMEHKSQRVPGTKPGQSPEKNTSNEKLIL